MDIGVDYVEPKTGTTAEDMATMLRDRVFVDYFNVYLSLPIFSQRLLYMFDDKDFEFDPPLKRKGQTLDRGKLIGWLLEERLPHFMTSELYLDYVICRQLMETQLKLTSSAHRLDYEDIYLSDDRDILHTHLGHVLGMCQLRHYLAGSSGETVLEFCKDAERFRRVPPEQETRQRYLFRLMQLKYFRPGGFVSVDEPAVWQALNDSERAIDEVNLVLSWSCEDSATVPCQLIHLTSVLCGLLRSYWVPKFVIHCRQRGLKSTLKPDQHKVRSTSDLGVLRQLKDIDRTLALAQGNLQPSPRTRERKSAVTWSALFPEYEIDDSFLNATDDVVTLHADGRLVVESLGSRQLSEELLYYTKRRVDLITPSSSEASSSDEVADSWKEEESGDVGANLTAGHLPRLVGPSLRGETQLRPGSSITEAIRRAEDSRRATQPHQPALPVLVSNECRDTASQTSAAAEDRRPCSAVPSLSSTKPCRLPQLAHRPRTQQTGRGQADILELPAIKDNAGRKPPFARPIDMVAKRTVSIHPALPTEGDVHNKTGFRKTNSYLLNALSADQLAGGPLKTYIRSQESREVTLCLSFWQEAHTYLALENTVTVNSNITDHVRHRRARALVIRHLMATSRYHLPLAKTLQESLVRLLPKDEANGLLRQAQDAVVEIILPHWKDFCRRDRDIFQQTMIISRPSRVALPKAHTHGDHRRQAEDTAVSVVPSEGALSRGWGREAGDHWPPVGGEPNYVELSERRAWRALQLAMDGLRLDPCCVGLEALPLEELAYEPETQEGSLALKKLVVIRRVNLEAKLARRRIVAQAAFKARLARVRAQEILDSIPDVDESLPPFARPFQKDGRWICRPSRPRTYADMTRSAIHMEFFRRYLATHFVEAPVLLWQAVEHLKHIKDPRQRQTTVNQILRRYFFSKRFRELDCTSEVIQEIPKMDKVTPAMLISAQACIGRDFEQRWFKIYQNTFPDTLSRNVSAQKVVGGDRKWGKQKTRNLWVEFVRRVMRFRESILREKLFAPFCEFLRRETKKERERQRAMGNTTLGLGVPVRKVVKNKLVDMTKLVADVSFLAEGERYRSLCDNATEAAQSGIYRTGDQQLLELKGETIVNCYLSSEIPPKLQINISLEMSERIVQNFRNGLVDRSLFYGACMTVFPHIGYFWKKWQKFRILDMFLRCDKKSELIRTPTRPATPDYMHLRTENAKIVNVHDSNDEDNVRVLFSMSQGVRVFRPMPRERVPSAQMRRDQQLASYRTAMKNSSHSGSKLTLPGSAAGNTGSKTSLKSEVEEEKASTPPTDHLARFQTRRKSRRQSHIPDVSSIPADRVHRLSLGGGPTAPKEPRVRRLSLMPGMLSSN